MTKRKRIFALSLALAMLLVLFFSVFYLAKEVNHPCTGENCLICQELQACTQTLSQFGCTPSIPTLMIAAAYVLLALAVPAFRSSAFHTLVSLKVKLSD